MSGKHEDKNKDENEDEDKDNEKDKHKGKDVCCTLHYSIELDHFVVQTPNYKITSPHLFMSKVDYLDYVVSEFSAIEPFQKKESTILSEIKNMRKMWLCLKNLSCVESLFEEEKNTKKK